MPEQGEVRVVEIVGVAGGAVRERGPARCRRVRNESPLERATRFPIRRTGGQYFPSVTPAGYAASERGYPCSQVSPLTIAAVCGALANGLSAAGHSPEPTLSISARIATIASTNRSSSARSSDSVGSTISVPGTGNDIVGAWNP